MTFTEAAEEVLKLTGKPMHYKDITDVAIQKNLLSHIGKSPEVTMGARLASLIKKEDDNHPIVRTKAGVFALRTWRDKKEVPASSEDLLSHEPPGDEINALELSLATQELRERARTVSTPPFVRAEEAESQFSEDDVLRATLAVSGAKLFEDEDDDDQPIFSSEEKEDDTEADPDNPLRRRRRRRRRGGRTGEDSELPAVTISSRGPEGRAPALRYRNKEEGDVPSRPRVPTPNVYADADGSLLAGEELAVGNLSEAASLVIDSFDRNAGWVSLRAVADLLIQRGRFVSDPATAASHLAAALRADNVRRLSSGQRPRFRFANGSKVALVEWSLGPDALLCEQDALDAVERSCTALRKVLLRRVQDLPGYAFVELALLLLERVGVRNLKPVRRSGPTGGEAHFSGVHHTGIDQIPVGILIRKDARDIGRERVLELRGALHHYHGASAGWLITAGQILSGAREESSEQAVPCITAYDGLGFCQLLEKHGVGVIPLRFEAALPDLDLFDALRA